MPHSNIVRPGSTLQAESIARLEKLAVLFYITMTILFSVAVLIASASSSMADDPAEILKKLAARRAEVKSLDHVTETIIRTEEASRKIKSHLVEERSGGQIKFRLLEETKATSVGKKEATTSSLTVCDGTTQWQQKQVPGASFVIKSLCAPPKPLGKLLAQAKGAKTRIRAGDTVHGLRCQVVDIVGERDGHPFKATYWITDDSGLVVRSAEVDAGGRRIEMDTISLKVNEPVDPLRFAYEPPSDATVIDTGTMKSSRRKNAKP